MGRFLIVLLLTLGIGFTSFSQTQKYWVRLTDKDNVAFNPYTYFDLKAIERRVKNNIPLVEFTDLPIREDYYQLINQKADSITGHTRWFNAIACWLTAAQLAQIKQLPFVKEVVLMTGRQELSELNIDFNGLSTGEHDLLLAQINSLEGNLFDNLYTGKGIRICIIDAGFPGVDNSKMFEHIRANNRIIKTWDFKKNKPEVYKYNSHGTTVLSCIAGIYGDKKIGMATDAEFLLARTERIAYEGIAEEEDWLEAVEWADKNGADIINSSLGYTNASHFLEDMDGNTTVISRAANLAAHKGILVVNSAGNDGTGKWKYVAAPGDADSALTVGGINPWTGLHTAFSSFGPNANHRLKPNVSAYGHAMGFNTYSKLSEVRGTSFASPLVAGFAACVWELDTSLTNMQLFKEIERSASLYPYYDYATGYGMPKASYFIDSLKSQNSAQTFTIDTTDNVQFIVTVDTAYFIENRAVQTVKALKKSSFYHLNDDYSTNSSNIPTNNPNVLYFHVENERGYLDEYQVIAVNQQEVLRLFYDNYKGKTIRFSYLGHVKELKL